MTKYFNRWFKKQFGGLPMSGKKADALRNELYALRQRENEIEIDLNCDSIIRAQYTAAQYSRTAFADQLVKK